MNSIPNLSYLPPYPTSAASSCSCSSSSSFNNSSVSFVLKTNNYYYYNPSQLSGSTTRIQLKKKRVCLFRAKEEKIDIVNNEKFKEEDEGEENSSSNKPRRIAIFVEPSPFAYVSGYKNRFQNFIKNLREMGDEVMVVTNHEGLPQEFHGAKIIGSWSFPCPWYQKVPLSLALSPRIIGEVAKFKPDIIHASSPGIMVFGALVIAKLLSIPIVMSYHTHVPIYIPRYTFSWLVKPMWLIIKFLHRAADLTLVPSLAISRDLLAAHVTSANRIRLWNKGVDSDNFHPRFRNYEMRVRLSGGEPKKPLLIHVGRLGVEKSLDFLKRLDCIMGSLETNYKEVFHLFLPYILFEGTYKYFPQTA